ncbi:hypothetical protein BKA70DRAFT_670816 [Coprinopsis sp. MPI-PUGE-AT-0042]|nr:hypothetical protein BKA70DRAFT_670816 [Coprinopsis sp. MPI-PUGE-AT-0042]
MCCRHLNNSRRTVATPSSLLLTPTMSEPNGSLSCKIPANTDISGVGVRSAIYAQNLLCLLSALWALWDGKVTQGKLDYAEMQTTTNLILAFAILISSIVQAYTLGISNYHANIVLMMSWMNNTNTFVYFILYIHHKIGLQESEGGVDKTWRAWVKHVKDRFSFTLTGSNGKDTEARITDNDGTTDGNNRAGAKILVKRFALVLGSLHLTLMAALGIWLWSDLQLFEQRLLSLVKASRLALPPFAASPLPSTLSSLSLASTSSPRWSSFSLHTLYVAAFLLQRDGTCFLHTSAWVFSSSSISSSLSTSRSQGN